MELATGYNFRKAVIAINLFCGLYIAYVYNTVPIVAELAQPIE